MTAAACVRSEFPTCTVPRPSRARWRHRHRRRRLRRRSSSRNRRTARRVTVTSVRYWWGPGEGGGERLAAHHRSLYAPADSRGRPIVAEPLSCLLQPRYHNCFVIVLRARNRFTRQSPAAERSTEVRLFSFLVHNIVHFGLHPTSRVCRRLSKELPIRKLPLPVNPRSSSEFP